MIEETQLTKLYYSIGEVADMFDVNTSLIRFWEKEFPSIQPQKNSKGKRLFKPKDVLEIQKIYHLTKVRGFTLEGARKTLKDKSMDVFTVEELSKEELILRLEGVKNKLMDLKS